MLTFGTVMGILVIAVSIMNQFREPAPEKIFEVYSQPGKWYRLKFFIISFILFIRRLKYYIMGKTYFHEEKDLDKPQELSTHDLAFDAVFFHAVSKDGIYFCGGTERRHNGKIVGLVYIVHPKYGVLESKELPNTILEADVGSSDNRKFYSGGGICFTPIIPMRKWKMEYQGLMRVQNLPKKFVNVKFEADWTSPYKWFFFEVDVPIKVLAKAIATEPWSRQLFKNLKEAHQSHYEQMGYITGTLTIENDVTKLTDVDSFRDHSFGFKRDWSLLHRYIYSMIYLSDRTKIVVGVVSQPCTTSHLEMGFVNHPNSEMEYIEKVDLVLHKVAENGKMPYILKFKFQTAKKSYDVQMKFIHDCRHFKGPNGEAVLRERFHQCEVNGIPGKGISEWHYNRNIIK